MVIDEWNNLTPAILAAQLDIYIRGGHVIKKKVVLLDVDLFIPGA